MAATMHDLLTIMIERGASDLHITTGTAPQIRVSGKLIQLTEFEQLTRQDTQRLAYSVLNEAQKQKFEEENELDLSFGIHGLARFRCNVYRQRGAVACAIRVIPIKIRSFDELGLPPVVEQLADRPKGLILVTGPTGSGKSTTLAAMVDKINNERSEHIVTIEDPIEFVHQHKKCLVNQREVFSDTQSFKNALKYILRQDPDVVLVGEMRDLETIAAALTIAETGHLTLGTLHTNSCAQTMNRIIDVFPTSQQDQVRAQLALVLEGVLSQTLIPKVGGGRVMSMEIMVATPAIRNLIREEKIHQIYSAIATGLKFGMQTMNQSLADLTRRKLITREEALNRSTLPEELIQLLGNEGVGPPAAATAAAGASPFAKRWAGTLPVFAYRCRASTVGVAGVIAREVEGGATLAESFRKYPKVFDDLFTNMLQVGESGGVLDVVLQRLSGYIEKAAKLKSKVKGAMVYPVTIIGVAMLVIIFMMIFVIPTFAKMFQGMGADLPLPTKIVMFISEFTQRYIIFMVLAIVGTIYAIKRYYASDQGSKVIDAFLLKIPVIGMLIRKVAVARFTRTLGTLISSGVPILEGLLITARSAGNRVVEREVMGARTAVTSGRTLSDPLRGSTVFPPMVVHMINVGENTGALDQMLSKIADFYDDEVDTAVTALTSLLEPIMIVFLGVVVGGLVVAMYLPIFRLVTLIK